MATEKFNNACESLFTGLLRDSESDVAYDHVVAAFTLFHGALAAHTEVGCPEKLQLVFIQLLKAHQPIRSALKARDLAQLLEICLAHGPLAVSGDLREIFTGLRCGNLFKHDAAKKMWKRIKKIVISCNLHDLVYGENDRDDCEPVPDQHSRVVEARVHRFNKGYREFVVQMSNVFSPGDGAVEAFDAQVKADENKIISEFKAHVLPAIPPLATKLQENKSAEGVAVALKEYFGDDSAWVKKLPLMNLLNIDGHWALHMADKETRESIMKAVADLMVCMSGIDTLLYSPIVHALRQKTIEIMKREKMTAETMIPTSDGFDKAGMMNMVMELVDEIPSATGNKISQADMKTLIANCLSGRDEVPASFMDVFSPDMIDMDCLETLTELPGIGDALAPLLASMEGQLKGTIGAPVFASVEKPAWLKRE